MIKFSGKTDKGIMIGLGLSRENVNRLTAGQPIIVDLESLGLGLPKGQIGILFGETEQWLYEQLKGAGLIKPETKVTKDPKLDGP